MMKRLIILLSVLLSGSALAATYQYTSPYYTSTTPYAPPCLAGATCADYTTAMRVTGSFTTAAPLPANYSGSIIGLVTAYSFSDGINTISNSGTGSRIGELSVITDAGGAIVHHTVWLQQWQNGAGVHNASDWFNEILDSRNNNHHQGRKNQSCSAVGVSPAGVADSCITTQFPDPDDYSSGYDIGFAPGVWALAPSSATSAIPSLSEWGLIALGGILALAALFRLRQDEQV